MVEISDMKRILFVAAILAVQQLPASYENFKDKQD